MRKVLFFVTAMLMSLSIFAQDRYQDENDYVHIAGDRTSDNYHVTKYSVTSSNREYVLATPWVDTSFKVYDFASVLSDASEKDIAQRCKQFIANTGREIFVVTVKSNNRSTADYLADFYAYNDFKDNGFCMIIDLCNDRTWLMGINETRDFLTGDRISEYGSVMRPLFDNGRYADEIMYFINHVEQDWLSSRRTIMWISMGIGLLIALIIFFVHRAKYKLVFKATSANNYTVKNSFVLTGNRTDFVRTYTTKTYSPQQKSGGGRGGSGSSGGGYGGGGF